MLCTSFGGWVLACGPEGAGVEDGGPSCADAILDPSELCDDGNRLAGDGCSPSCVPSGLASECVALLEGSDRNEVRALAPLADRSFVAAGGLATHDGIRAWVARFDELGATLWFEQLASPAEGDARVVDLAADGSGGVWALAVAGTIDRLIHLDPTGTTTASLDLDAEAGFAVDAYVIESVDSAVWVAGASQGDLWLARVDSTNTQLTTVMLEDHLGFADEIRAIERTASEIVVAATLSTSPNSSGDQLLVATTDIALVRFDLQGNELGRIAVSDESEPGFARRAASLATDGQGGWYVGGIREPLAPLADPRLWIARVGQPSEGLDWEWTNADSFASVGFGGILGTDDGVIVAAGSLEVSESPSIHGWLGGLGGDGTARWQRAEAAAGYEFYAHQVLARDHEGRVRFAGMAWRSDESSLIRSCLIAQ